MDINRRQKGDGTLLCHCRPHRRSRRKHKRYVWCVSLACVLSLTEFPSAERIATPLHSRVLRTRSGKFELPRPSTTWRTEKPFPDVVSPIKAAMEKRFSPVVPEKPANATSTQKRQEPTTRTAQKRKLENNVQRNLKAEFDKMNK